MSQIIQRTFGAGTDGISPTDFILNLDATSGAVAVILPPTSVYRETNERIGQTNNSRGFNYRFTQIGRNVTTILAATGDTINGLASIVIPEGSIGTIVLTGDSKWAIDIANPASLPVSQFAVRIEQFTDGGEFLQIVSDGGTPSTYFWDLAQNAPIFGPAMVFSSNVVAIPQIISGSGNVRCRVMDTLGRVAYGYFISQPQP